MRIVFHEEAFDALRKSPGVVALLETEASKLLAQVGAGYKTEPVYMGKKRARVSVATANAQGRATEARDHKLLLAIGGSAAGSGMESYTSRSGRTSMITSRQAANYRSRSRR